MDLSNVDSVAVRMGTVGHVVEGSKVFNLQDKINEGVCNLEDG